MMHGHHRNIIGPVITSLMF